MTAQLDTARLDVVVAKAGEWRDRLIDLGFRNTLLYFRDTKHGSLDLTAVDSSALADLEDGKRVSLRALFPDTNKHRDACARARSLCRRIQLFDDEQGIDVGRVAFGLIRTNPLQHKGLGPVPALRAPLLLRPVVLKARTAAQSDYSIEFSDEAEFNPVLLHALDSQYGLDVDKARAELERLLGETTNRAVLVEQAHAALARIADTQGIELRLDPAMVLGTFNYEKLPMVEDLASATDLLESHDLIAALAGYAPAREALALEASDYAPPDVDQLQPADEYLVHDADSSQHRAIMAALAGRHVYIEGPPGTGKSQTIANIIAGAAATGKKVLFVAEKRAAIEAVTNRLITVGLGGLMFDLHQQSASKREVARQLAESLDQVTKEPPVEADEVHMRLVASRRRLLDHSRELHTRRAPWGLSAYEARDRLLDLPDPAIPCTFRGQQLQALDARVAQGLEEQLKEFVDLGGLRILRRETPWCNTDVRDRNDVERILIELDQLADQTLHRSQQGIDWLLTQTGLIKPDNVAGWQDLLTLLDDVSKTVDTFGADIFGDKLDSYFLATGRKELRQRLAPNRKMGWKERYTLVKELRTMSRDGVKKKAKLNEALSKVREQQHRWQQLGGPGSRPGKVQNLDDVSHDYQVLRTQLAAVAASARRPELTSGPAPQIERQLEELRADKAMLFRMPQLNTHLDYFQRLGLNTFLGEVAQRNLTADEVWEAFRRVWLTSLDDEFKIQVPELGQFVPEQLSRAGEEFRATDIAHRELAARRVRRHLACKARQASDTYPDQARILRQQASRKTRHMPTRKLVEQASNVLLALRPCWAMSPLVVSRMLPAERLFDLVIFDEASQIRPHDAITSIMRGARVVVAGDEKQLPPSDFFERVLASDGEDEDVEDDLADYESILTALRPLLPTAQMLTWHYRSADERLIAFSNREIYKEQLVTFPGSAKDSPVSLVRVYGEASPGQKGSSPAEVDKVVELILHHARTRPTESLGVITPNITHQARIERGLAQARQDHPDLDEFFSEEVEPGRRFFVKNIESVQGDERDAIILSVGVARSAGGRIVRTGFGLLNRKGTERRVNVAVTRAKLRMTVVASFSAADLAPTEMTGTELLRRYLDFAEHHGRIDEVGAPVEGDLNGFERAIYDALRARNVPVYPQWGFSDYCIDFALAHPDQPGRMVLAVEADGHRYHSSTSARDRDRLRQAHLERLGWRFHRLWSSAWFQDPQAETDKIVAAWQRAVKDDDAPREPETDSASIFAAEPAPTVRRRLRPSIRAGLRIQDYSDRELIEICRWLMTDRLQLDREERLIQAMAELGFRRRGTKITERLLKAIDIAQHLADKEE
ncbi:AAA domain-containing protein [Nocardia sp. NPDC049149]|uniref:AAA domain-containing protein n=1 Tax=Nocardia sp. NPDC049149 TaxID=3364315 RepID=UPI003720EDD2